MGLAPSVNMETSGLWGSLHSPRGPERGERQTLVQRAKQRKDVDVPGDSVVKAPHFQCWGLRCCTVRPKNKGQEEMLREEVGYRGVGRGRQGPIQDAPEAGLHS